MIIMLMYKVSDILRFAVTMIKSVVLLVISYNTNKMLRNLISFHSMGGIYSVYSRAAILHVSLGFTRIV